MSVPIARYQDFEKENGKDAASSYCRWAVGEFLKLKNPKEYSFLHESDTGGWLSAANRNDYEKAVGQYKAEKSFECDSSMLAAAIYAVLLDDDNLIKDLDSHFKRRSANKQSGIRQLFLNVGWSPDTLTGSKTFIAAKRVLDKKANNKIGEFAKRLYCIGNLGLIPARATPINKKTGAPDEKARKIALNNAKACLYGVSYGSGKRRFRPGDTLSAFLNNIDGDTFTKRDGTKALIEWPEGMNQATWKKCMTIPVEGIKTLMPKEVVNPGKEAEEVTAYLVALSSAIENRAKEVCNVLRERVA